jgi:hypothetical protein
MDALPLASAAAAAVVAVPINPAPTPADSSHPWSDSPPQAVESEDPLHSPSSPESLHITDGLCESCQQLDFETLITGTEDVFKQFVDKWGDLYGRQTTRRPSDWWDSPAEAAYLQEQAPYKSIMIGTWASLQERATQGCRSCVILMACQCSFESDDECAVLLVQQPPRKDRPSAVGNHAIDRHWQVHVGALQFSHSTRTSDRSFVRAASIIRLFDHPSSDWKRVTPMCDMSRANHWLDSCRRHDRCNQTYLENRAANNLHTIFPRRVIDLTTSTIVKSNRNSSPEYVTLSYVWGQDTNDFLLTTNSPGWARGPSGKAYFPLPEDLPATLVDALAVVRTLGFRYLWVDRLCILQDDPTEVHSEIHNMSAIFSNAAICIIAAAGNGAHSGLPGISTSRSRFTLEPIPLRSSTGQICRVGILPPSISHAVEESEWAHRAWTYQEFKLSRRCLIFTKNELFWYCQTVRNRESYVGSDISEERLVPPDEDTFGLYGDFGRLGGRNIFGLSAPGELSYAYESCAKAYSYGKLTRQSDKLDAFAGLSSFLGALYRTPVVFGIPRGILFQWLLWERICSDAPNHNAMERIIRSNELAKRSVLLPSWCWLARQGKMNTHWRLLKDAINVRQCKDISFYDSDLVPEIILPSSPDLFMTKISQWPPGTETLTGLLPICGSLGYFKLRKRESPGDQPLMVLSASYTYLGTCVADDVSFEPLSHSFAFIGLGKCRWPALCNAIMVKLVEMPFAEIGGSSRRSEMDLRDYLSMVVDGEISPIDIDEKRFRPEENVRSPSVHINDQAFDDSNVYLAVRLGIAQLSLAGWEKSKEAKRSMIFLG